MDIVGQLSGQMAEMVGGVVETVGEEPEPESEGIPEQHEEEEEELTKVSHQCHLLTHKFDYNPPKNQVFFQLEQVQSAIWESWTLMHW